MLLVRADYNISGTSPNGPYLYPHVQYIGHISEQNLDNDLCQAVVTQGGKTVWLRGQCPQNLDDAVNLDSHDPVAQTHKVMQNIKQLIEEAGGNLLANDRVPQAIVDAYLVAPGHIGDRLIAALRAERDAGDEKGERILAVNFRRDQSA